MGRKGDVTQGCCSGKNLCPDSLQEKGLGTKRLPACVTCGEQKLKAKVEDELQNWLQPPAVKSPRI